MINKAEQFGQKFIYFILVLWLSTEVLFSSNIEYFFIWEKDYANDFMAVVVLVLLMIQIILLQKYSFEEMMIIGLITLPIAIATVNSNHKIMMSTWIFIVAAKYLDIDKTIRLSFIVQLLMICLVIYMFYSGYIEETTTYRGEILRHSLGFSHPNQLGIRVFQLVLCHCYLRKNKINVIDYGIIVAAAWFIRFVADSKTSFYSMIILFLLLAIHDVINKISYGHELFANLMIFIYVIANSLSILFSVTSIKRVTILNSFDRFMSSRFSQCHRTYNYYGTSLLGQDVQLFVRRHIIGQIYHFWLDNAYMAILLRYGLIVFMIFSGLYLYTMIYLKKTKQYTLLEILALYAIYGVMENNFFSMSQNIFLIVLAAAIYCRNDERRIIERRIQFTW